MSQSFVLKCWFVFAVFKFMHNLKKMHVKLNSWKIFCRLWVSSWNTGVLVQNYSKEAKKRICHTFFSSPNHSWQVHAYKRCSVWNSKWCTWFSIICFLWWGRQLFTFSNKVTFTIVFQDCRIFLNEYNASIPNQLWVGRNMNC